MTSNISALPPRFLRTKEAADFLGLSARALEKHRTYGTGPSYRKLGGRVVYAVDDLQAWTERGAVTSTLRPTRHGASRQASPPVLSRCNTGALRSAPRYPASQARTSSRTLPTPLVQTEDLLWKPSFRAVDPVEFSTYSVSRSAGGGRAQGRARIGSRRTDECLARHRGERRARSSAGDGGVALGPTRRGPPPTRQTR